MARRRYLSTEISIDKAVNRLAREHGDFAALLYTWMIPHAEDDATLTGDPEELMLSVVPGRRDKDVADVERALAAMHDLGLIRWDREAKIVEFPLESFYKYQTYIPKGKRRSAQTSDYQRKTPKLTDEQRAPATNAASPSPSPTLSLSPSPTEEEEGAPAGAEPVDWIRWYEQTTTQPPSRKEMRDAAALIERGVTEELIIEAIRRAIEAKKRQPATYALRVLANMQPYGVKTVADWNRLECDQQRTNRPRDAPKGATGFDALLAIMARESDTA